MNGGPTRRRRLLPGDATNLEERLEVLLSPVAASMGLEILELKLSLRVPGCPLKIVLDRQDGAVALDDCVAFSREASVVLDAVDLIESAYRLEVSSPGIERKLTRPRDFERFKGSEVAVVFETDQGSRRIEGVLLGLCGEDHLAVETPNARERVRLDAVTRANLKFSFGKKAGAAGKRGR